MRARLVRPAFWRDSKMGELPIPARLTYIGTWGLADDAGYLEWDLRQIAAEIYVYEPVKRREAMVLAHLDRLVAAGRIVVQPCHRHAFIPRLPVYGALGGTKVETTKKAHEACVPSTSAMFPEVPGEIRSYLGSSRDVVRDESGLGSLARAREEGLPHIDEATSKLVEQLTGRTILQGGHKQLTELDRLVEDHGAEKVQDALRTVAKGHDRLTARQLVWPAMKLLEPMPNGKELAQAERTAETDKREDRIVEQMRRRRLEAWSHGVWYPEWGPRPDAKPVAAGSPAGGDR